jgi:DNA-binding transcriptional ArsR family regulator
MNKEVQKVKNQPAGSNLNLFIFQQLQRGLNPAKISKLYNLSKTRISYHLSSLKKAGFVKNIGYGVWKVLKDFDEKEVQKTTHIAMSTSIKDLNLFKPDSVRAHAFQFILAINPNLKNWNRRAEILQKLGIEFKPLNIFGGGQSLVFKGRRIWMTSKSIIIFEKSSYMAETSQEARKYAVYDFIELVGALERFLRADFGATRGKLRFKVSRQHYALIKNALAKQYDKEGKKLYVTNEQGRWFEIDNSFNLHEAETIHPKTADQDNKKVQDFFNGIKQFEGFTPQMVMNSIGQVTNNQTVFAENMKSHIAAIQKLGCESERLGRAVEQLTKAVREKR